jgi:hypothetical protein
MQQTQSPTIDPLILQAAKRAAIDAARAEVRSIFRNEVSLPSVGKYLPLELLSERYGKRVSTVKFWFWQAKKLGIELPPRVRAGKNYLYNIEAFERWITQNADALRSV